MRVFLLSFYTLAFFTMIYAAPTHNSAGNCEADGNCVNESVSRELAARGNENLFYELPGISNPNNNAELGVVQVVTEVAYAPATVTHVVVATVQHSSPTSGSHSGLLDGLLDGLLSGPHPLSPKLASSNHNSLPNGLPGSNPAEVLPAIEQLLSPTENQVKVDLS